MIQSKRAVSGSHASDAKHAGVLVLGQLGLLKAASGMCVLQVYYDGLSLPDDDFLQILLQRKASVYPYMAGSQPADGALNDASMLPEVHGCM